MCDLGCCVRQVGLEAPVAPGVGARGEWTGSEQGRPEALWSLQPPRSRSSGGKPLPGMRPWPGAGWVSEESLRSSPSDDFLPGQREHADCVQSEGWIPPGWFTQHGFLTLDCVQGAVLGWGPGRALSSSRSETDRRPRPAVHSGRAPAPGWRVEPASGRKRDCNLERLPGEGGRMAEDTGRGLKGQEGPAGGEETRASPRGDGNPGAVTGSCSHSQPDPRSAWMPPGVGALPRLC